MPALAPSLRRALSAPPSLHALPKNEWTTLHQRVFFALNAALRGGPYGPFRAAPEFGAMIAVCAEWRERTFPTLVAMLREVDRYARETVARQYPLIEAAIVRKDKRAIADLVEQLQRDAGVIVALAQGLVEMVTRFRKANEALDDALGKSGSAWLMLVPKPQHVDRALQLLQGEWRALADDLEAVHAAIFAGTVDDLTVDDVRVARDSWSDLVAETDDFIRMAEGQQSVLDGFFVAPIVHIRAGTSRDGTIALQSHRNIGVTRGDRLIVFGAGPIDGRHEIVEVTSPSARAFPQLWSYTIRTAARPKDGWMTYDGIRWLRTPIASALGNLATVEHCEAQGARVIVRIGEELPLDTGTRLNVVRPEFSGTIVERQQWISPAGDRFWHYTVDARLPAGSSSPKAVWAGLYRDDA